MDKLIGSAIRSMVVNEIGPTIMGLILCGRIGASVCQRIINNEGYGANRCTGGYGYKFKKIFSITQDNSSTNNVSNVSNSSGFYFCFLRVILWQFISWMSTSVDFLDGITLNYETYLVVLSIFKSAVFGFLVTSLASFHGFNTTGGALEIGNTTTRAVAQGCMAILLSNYFIVSIFM